MSPAMTSIARGAAGGSHLSNLGIEPMPRRGFLRGLISLPLIGGAIELIGSPRAVALEATEQLMFEYGKWLSWERVSVYRVLNGGHGSWADDEARSLSYHEAYGVAQQLHAERDSEGRCYAFAPKHTYEGENSGLRSHASRWHQSAPSATARAALVLSAVGCDWRGPYLTDGILAAGGAHA